MPPWLADSGDGTSVGFGRWLSGRAVAAALGLALWWTGIPTRWVLATLAALAIVGAGLCFLAGRVARVRDDVGEAAYLTGELLFQVAQFVSWVLLAVVVLRYGLADCPT